MASVRAALAHPRGLEQEYSGESFGQPVPGQYSAGRHPLPVGPRTGERRNRFELLETRRSE